MKLSNNNIKHFLEREEPYFASYMVVGGMLDKKAVKKYFGFERFCRLIQTIQQNNNNFYYYKLDYYKLIKQIKIKLKDKNYVEKLIEDCKREGKNLIISSMQIEKESKSKLSKCQMANLLERYYKQCVNFCAFIGLSHFDELVTDQAKHISEKYGCFSLITSPIKKTAAEFEQADFLKTKINRLSAAEHSEKYGWLSLRFFIGKPWTQNNVEIRLKNINRNTAKKILLEKNNKKRILKKQIKKLLSEVTKKEQRMIENIHGMIYLRTFRMDIFNHSSYYILPLLKKISEQLKISKEDLLNFSPEEIVGALRNYKSLDIIKRKNEVVILHSDRNTVLEGKNAKDFMKKYSILKKVVRNISSLSGNIANPGIISGRAKIVKTNNDIKKVNKGDILVSVMTTPNLIEAMEKASAFVTDEGGILCHASIIAREMGKPCVIGTKYATKVFKDGDEILVDANKGIVRKIK